jgi:hypothetical protein
MLSGVAGPNGDPDGPEFSLGDDELASLGMDNAAIPAV